jgi:hypothetical protein
MTLLTQSHQELKTFFSAMNVERLTLLMHRKEQDINRQQAYITKHGIDNDKSSDAQWENYKIVADDNLKEWDAMKEARNDNKPTHTTSFKINGVDYVPKDRIYKELESVLHSLDQRSKGPVLNVRCKGLNEGYRETYHNLVVALKPRDVIIDGIYYVPKDYLGKDIEAVLQDVKEKVRRSTDNPSFYQKGLEDGYYYSHLALDRVLSGDFVFTSPNA